MAVILMVRFEVRANQRFGKWLSDRDPFVRVIGLGAKAKYPLVMICLEET